jgi:hypothetical protein
MGFSKTFILSVTWHYLHIIFCLFLTMRASLCRDWYNEVIPWIKPYVITHSAIHQFEFLRTPMCRCSLNFLAEIGQCYFLSRSSIVSLSLCVVWYVFFEFTWILCDEWPSSFFYMICIWYNEICLSNRSATPIWELHSRNSFDIRIWSGFLSSWEYVQIAVIGSTVLKLELTVDICAVIAFTVY